MLVVIIVDASPSLTIGLRRRPEIGYEDLLDLISINDRPGCYLVGQVEQDDEYGDHGHQDEKQNERFLIEHEPMFAPTELIKRIHHHTSKKVDKSNKKR